MNIMYEKSLVFGDEFLSDIGRCSVFDTGQLTPHDLVDVDALLVRSTTQVNQQLLQHANRLSFVATGTAGFDHIDTDYLSSKDITLATAAGCNAVAVAEYVLSCLLLSAQKFGGDICSRKVGIVGAGHVGTALSERLTALGVEHILCDPLLQQAGDPRVFNKLEDVLSCDVISFHVPWTTAGHYPTHHLLSAEHIGSLSQQQIVINACRGEVIDETALLQRLKQGNGPQVFLDVWQNEPAIDKRLLPYVHIATPHIAGHSLEGKARGTEFIYRAMAKHFSIPCSKTIYDFLPEPLVKSVTVTESVVSLQTIQQLMLLQYDCQRDDYVFRDKLVKGIPFTQQRKQYRIRREYSALQVFCQHSSAVVQLKQLGFDAMSSSPEQKLG